MSLTLALKWFIFKRYYARSLDDFNLIWLDYPVEPRPRFTSGHPELLHMFDRARAEIERFADSILVVSNELLEVASETMDRGPTFVNNYFLGLDAAAYYAAIARFRPKTLIEVGSGYSTRFARAAITAASPSTRLIAIDPSPRADVAAICDEIISAPLETVDQSIFRRLQAGDILFMDSSHRCFQNSDVTVFFLEILPRLQKGAIVHIHDVLLPYDYPPEWCSRYYSEQYLLACWLLSNPERCQILFSSAFASRDPALTTKLNTLWNEPRFIAAKTHAEKITKGYMGYSFWARV